MVLSPPLVLYRRPWRLSSLPLLLLQQLQCGCRQQMNNGVVLFLGVAMAQEAPNPRLQQLPPFTTSATTTTSFRQDFCNLTAHNNSSNMSSSINNIGSILQGVALNSNILLGEFIQFDFHGGGNDQNNNNNNIILNNNMTLNADYPGLMARLMDEICVRAGCTWRNTYSITSAALPPNRTYSDLLVWATDNYDISVDWWLRSTERMFNGAAFIEPWCVCYVHDGYSACT
jgi:hypothetical protein